MKPLQPLIPDEQAPPEFRTRSIILAGILTVLFGTASGYLGLQIGMTFAASIPAAIMSLAILRGLFRDSNILESNMVQTQASSGESLMGGVIFIIPALFFLNLDPSWIEISMMALAGGLLGVFLMIPLRNNLIVQQHQSLPYPEGIACANILKLGEESHDQTRYIFIGMGIGALLNFINSGFKLLSGKIEIIVPRFWNLTLGMDVTPLMLGVGFLVGPLVGSTLFAGSILRGAVILPIMTWKYSNDPGMDIHHAITMIGAGAVATGGLISIIKMAPQMLNSLKKLRGAMKQNDIDKQQPRIHRNLSTKWVVLGLVLAVTFSLLSLGTSTAGVGSEIGVGIYALAVFLIIIVGFLFVALCARLVGFMGTSGYPLSGLTIGALLLTVFCLNLAGLSGDTGKVAAIVIGAVISIAIAVSADISQDLKTGVLLGATPFRQQIGETIGVLIAAIAAGGLIMLFQSQGTLNELPAPQARLMAAIVQSVMDGEFQWLFIGIGVAIALTAELFKISSIMVAVGLYLPPFISSGFLIGGLLRGYFDRKVPESSQKENSEKKGTVFASGLIAGWALMGVIVVGLTALGLNPELLSEATQIVWHGHWAEISISLAIYVGMAYSLFRILGIRSKKENN